MWHLVLFCILASIASIVVCCVVAIQLGWTIFKICTLVRDIILSFKELIQDNKRKTAIQKGMDNDSFMNKPIAIIVRYPDQPKQTEEKIPTALTLEI